MVRLAVIRLLTENFRERSVVFAEFKSWLLCVVFLKIIFEYYFVPKRMRFPSGNKRHVWKVEGDISY